MLDSSNRFLYGFFILFLCILLLMLVMVAVMVRYNADTEEEGVPSSASEKGREKAEAGSRDLTGLYRANLFVINLCLVVLGETLLMVVFVRYTVPATLIATLIVLFVGFQPSDKLRMEMFPRFMSRFVTNRYATLSHSDLVLLVILNGLIMAFLMSVLLKEPLSKKETEEPASKQP